MDTSLDWGSNLDSQFGFGNPSLSSLRMISSFHPCPWTSSHQSSHFARISGFSENPPPALFTMLRTPRTSNVTLNACPPALSESGNLPTFKPCLRSFSQNSLLNPKSTRALPPLESKTTGLLPSPLSFAFSVSLNSFAASFQNSSQMPKYVPDEGNGLSSRGKSPNSRYPKAIVMCGSVACRPSKGFRTSTGARPSKKYLLQSACVRMSDHCLLGSPDGSGAQTWMSLAWVVATTRPSSSR
mmetsp:Transcript_43446/g.94625  ORF Transcript_43446/g.94625 Transcript_43446/m.94625 type:complete len:241 (-) Transcript_43446:124-846(-)